MQTQHAGTAPNVVGYQDVGTAKVIEEETVLFAFPNVGMTFIPVSGAETFRLGDVIAKNLFPLEGEFIYQLNPECAEADDETFITYVDPDSAKFIINPKHPDQVPDEEAKEFSGWYDTDISEKIDDNEYAIGTAFIGGDLTCEEELKMQCSGAVNSLPQNIDISGLYFPHFANPVPRVVTLGEVKCTGINATNGEFFYQLNPECAEADDETFVTYVDRENAKFIINPKHPDQVSDEEADEFVGWYDTDISEEKNDLEVQPGECWLGGDLPGDDDVVVSFPKGA